MPSGGSETPLNKNRTAHRPKGPQNTSPNRVGVLDGAHCVRYNMMVQNWQWATRLRQTRRSEAPLVCCCAITRCLGPRRIHLHSALVRRRLQGAWITDELQLVCAKATFESCAGGDRGGLIPFHSRHAFGAACLAAWGQCGSRRIHLHSALSGAGSRADDNRRVTLSREQKLL